MFSAIALCVAAGFTAATPPDAIHLDKLKPTGEYYDATVPDTLDLAERARFSVHGLTSFLNEKANYGPYGHTYFNANPPYMSDMPGGPPNWGKIAESLIMTRIMCGSEENLDVEQKTLEGMLASPWMTINPVAPTPVSRAMLALNAVYQLDPNPALKSIVDGMAKAHRDVATTRDNLVFYNDSPPDLKETALGVGGTWMPVFIQGCAVRALTRWSNQTQDGVLRDFSGKLIPFLVQPQFWKPEAGPKSVAGAEHGQFSGHHHSYTQALMGLLTYATATNDAPLKEFVRESYEYMRTFGIARIGLFGEGCTTGDMTFLALKLSDTGVGDYWDDADRYVRNHLAELQITDADALRHAVETMPAGGRGKNDTTQGPLDPVGETNDRVVERNVGAFFSDSSHPTLIPEHNFLYTICCTGNCTPAMYAAWESIVRYRDGAAQVNLLLNRASAALDVDSYLPYEGKAVIRNKTAKKISVRIPRWVDKSAVAARIDDRPASLFWVGNYVVFDTVNAKDTITITFPITETTETFTLKWKQSEFWKESTNPGASWSPLDPPARYTCHFRGNTLTDISPRDAGPGYPLYQRGSLKRDAAPMKTVKRYLAPTLVSW